MRASFWDLSLFLLSCSQGVLAGPAAAVYGYGPAKPAMDCKTDPVCGDLRSHENPAIEFCRSYIKVPEVEVRITKITPGKTVTKVVEVKSTKTATVKKTATKTAITTKKLTKTKTATAKSTETDTATLKTTETDYLTLKSTEIATTTDVSTERSTILDISTETVTEEQITVFTTNASPVPQPTLTVEKREIEIMQRGQLGYRDVVIPPYLKKHAPARITLGCSCLFINPKKHTKTIYLPAKPTTKTITKTNCKTVTMTQGITETAKATKNIVDIVYTTVLTIATAIETEVPTDTTFITFISLTTLIITDSLTTTALTTVPTTTTATTTTLTTTTAVDRCAAPYPTSNVGGLGVYAPATPNSISAPSAHDCCKQCYENPVYTGCMEWVFSGGACLVAYGGVGQGASDVCPNGKGKVFVIGGDGGVGGPGPCNGGYFTGFD